MLHDESAMKRYKLNIHEYAVKILVSFDGVQAFLSVGGIDDNMAIKSEPLRQNCAIDVVILSYV